MVASSEGYTIAEIAGHHARKETNIQLNQLHFALISYHSWLKDVSAAGYDKANIYFRAEQSG